MTRAEKHAEVMRLRRSGMSNPEIAVELGLSASALKGIINDPDGSKQKARRTRYQGVCEDCGAATDGSNGRAAAPRWCRNCVSAHVTVWTREKIIEAIQAWAEKHGRPPRAHPDWARADETHPSSSTIVQQSSHPGAAFRSWADAIEAAGFPRPHVGVYGDREHWTPERIIRTIQAWNDEHGAPPTMDDWKGTKQGRPTAGCVVSHFGTWNNAISAAGLPPRKTSRPRRIAA